MDQKFIYREKVGLQSQTRKWILGKSMKRFIQDVLFVKDGVAESMMGNQVTYLKRAFSKDKVHTSLGSLVLSMVVIQVWCNIHRVQINK
jgi:hypothetical protein